MADTKISDLTNGNPALSGDQIPIARAGANYKITAGSVSSLALATPLAVTGNSTAGAELRLPEDTDNGSNYVALKAPDALASNVTFTLPNADGSNGQFLSTNGSGTLSWASGGGGSGDVVGPASSVDSQIALFDATTGKVIKAATTTGLLKATSGVIAAAASGTDYAPATSGTSILKGNGSGGFSNAAAGTDYAAATTGTNAQLLANSGSGGFSNVTVGSGLSYSAGTLTATGTSGLLFYRLEAGLAGANSTAVQQFLGVGVTLTSSTIYQFEALFLIVKTAGTTSHTVSIGFGGTATLNNISYQVAWNGNNTAFQYSTGGGNSAYTTAALSVATSSRSLAGEYSFFRIMGSVSINAGGTFIPQYQLSAAPGGAYTTQAGSFMSLLPVSNTGTWA